MSSREVLLSAANESERLRVSVATNHSNDLNESIVAPEEDYVTACVCRTNVLTEFGACVADFGMPRFNAALLPDLGEPLSRGNGLILSDESCDLF
jgi:hypothetical protein